MEYAVAGYALIWSSLVWFWWRTRQRLAEAERRLASQENE